MGSTTTDVLFLFFIAATAFAVVAAESGDGASSSLLPLRSPSLRHLPTASCSRLQHELQRSIMDYEWVGLERLRFQRRLRRHPRYIVTIENVVSAHDPLVELRCPGSPLETTLEIHFHESRFSARSVRLFDIRSIFPLHTGAMGGVRVRIPPMRVTLNKMSDLGRGVANVAFVEEGLRRSSEEDRVVSVDGNNNKRRRKYSGQQQQKGKDEEEDDVVRHREEEDSSVGTLDDGDGPSSSLVGVEREIEWIFVGRVLPLVKKQLEGVVFNTTSAFFANNLVLF